MPALRDRLADDLAAALADPHLRLPTDGRVLIPQMIVAADPAPADVMAARMEAGALCTLLLARMTEVDYRAPQMQEAFRRVVQPILQGMLDDPGLSATLQPAFTRAVAESLGEIGAALAQEEAESTACRLRLIDAGVEQDTLADNAPGVAARLIARAGIEGRDGFAELRGLREAWYVRGRDGGAELRRAGGGGDRRPRPRPRQHAGRPVHGTE